MESDTTPQPDPLLPPETGEPGMELPPDGVPVVIMAVPVSMETWFLPGVPLARPMSVLPCVGYTPARQDHEMSALRAIVEIILVIPIGIAGAVVAYLLTHQWGPSDERWLRIADTMGLGFGAMLACMAIVWIGRRRLSTIGITLRRFPIEIGLGIASWLPTWMMLIPLSLVLTVLLREQPTAQKAIEENFPHLSLRQMFLVCLACGALRGGSLPRIPADAAARDMPSMVAGRTDRRDPLRVAPSLRGHCGRGSDHIPGRCARHVVCLAKKSAGTDHRTPDPQLPDVHAAGLRVANVGVTAEHPARPPVSAIPLFNLLAAQHPTGPTPGRTTTSPSVLH